jgi:hypothetical protein
VLESNTMTNQNCINFCNGKGYPYAGTEYAGQCFCGTSIMSPGANTTDSDCNMACTGDATQPCGAGNRLSVYKTSQALTGPSTNPGPPGWTSLGCYIDNQGGRTLANGVQTTGGGNVMTIALCTKACQNAGYTLAGAEYGGECYCGNSFTAGGPAPDGSRGCK